MPTTADHPGHTHADQMSALKQGIDALADADFADVRFLDRYLSTNLASQPQEEGGNPLLLLRSSNGGCLAGMRLRKVELITTKNGDPSSSRLKLELAEPGPDAEAFANRYWPDAEFSPGRPHAAGSPSFWTTRRGKGIVSIYHPQDDQRIAGIGFSHEP